MRERLRWLGHVLRMKNDILPKIVLFGQLSRAKRKAGRQRNLEYIRMEDERA